MSELEPLAWHDRVFWEMSRDPTRPLVCGVWLGLDRAPDLARLRARIAELIDAFPRLRLRIEERGGVPCWTAAEPLELATRTQGAAEPGELVGQLAGRMHERLDPSRPPWRLTVVQAGEAHGLELRWHHALCDGEGMTALLGALSDDAAEPGAGRDLGRLDPALARAREPSDARTTRIRSSGLAWRLLRSRDRDVRARGSDRFGARPVFTSLGPRELAELRDRFEVSTNELLVGIASAAVLRHRLARGQRPAALRLLSPLGDRGDATRVILGNHSRALRLRLSVGDAPGVAELLARARDASREQLRAGRAAPYALYRLVFGLPDGLRDRLLARVPPHIVNVLLWPADTRWIAGARVERVHAFTPMLPFHGCTFAVVDYRGELHANLVYDTQLLAEPERLLACVDEVVAELV